MKLLEMSLYVFLLLVLAFFLSHVQKSKMQSKFVVPVDNFTQTVVNPARDAKKSWEAIKKDDLGITKSLEGVTAAVYTPSADPLKLYEHMVLKFFHFFNVLVQLPPLSNTRRDEIQ